MLLKVMILSLNLFCLVHKCGQLFVLIFDDKIIVMDKQKLVQTNQHMYVFVCVQYVYRCTYFCIFKIWTSQSPNLNLTLHLLKTELKGKSIN